MSIVHIIDKALARTGGQDGIRQVFAGGNRKSGAGHASSASYTARLLEEQT